MLGPSLKRNDVVLAASEFAEMPFGNRRFSLGHTFKENMNRHDERESAHRDVHLPVTYVVIGNGIHKNGQCGYWHERLHAGVGPSKSTIDAPHPTLINILTDINYRPVSGQAA